MAFQVVSTGAPTGQSTGIPEAPTDGQLYGRENAAWAVVPSAASDPTKVAKTGDTMTGQLVIKGDQFDGGITSTPIPALLMGDSSGANQCGISVGQYGDSVTVVKANGSPGFIRMGLGAMVIVSAGSTWQAQLGSGDPPELRFQYGGVSVGCVSTGDANDSQNTGDVQMKANQAGNGICLFSAATGERTRIHLAGDGSGDILCKSLTGPNAGKSVNLTAGTWA